MMMTMDTTQIVGIKEFFFLKFINCNLLQIRGYIANDDYFEIESGWRCEHYTMSIAKKTLILLLLLLFSYDSDNNQSIGQSQFECFFLSFWWPNKKKLWLTMWSRVCLRTHREYNLRTTHTHTHRKFLDHWYNHLKRYLIS